MGEQQAATRLSKCPHAEAVGKRWGDPISEERQAELQAALDAWNTPGAEHGDRKGPFADIKLAGSDVSWLVSQASMSDGGTRGLHLEGVLLYEAHLEGAQLAGVHLEGARLAGVHLEGAQLAGVYLEGANLVRAQLEHANLYQAHLEDANLDLANLGRASLQQAYLERASLDRACLEWAQLQGAHLDNTRLLLAQMNGANLIFAHLGRARLGGVHLEGANFRGADLEDANLNGAHLERASLVAAKMGGAILSGAHLENADFSACHMEHAQFNEAHLAGARLNGAHLAGAYFGDSRLADADLSSCWLDSTTIFNGKTTLSDGTKLGDIHWSAVGAVDLTQCDWNCVPTLGDEHGVGLRAASDSHVTVIRAYRQVAAQLRAQGMNEVADRFLYRAQTRQRWAHLSSIFHDWRRPWRWPGDTARYLGSLFLAVLAGYGYRPGRTLFWYVATVLSFMGGYWLVTHGVPLFGLTEPSGTQPLHWYEALVLSLASFHGRGFFPSGISLGDPVAILAAAEAVIGLFVEISFIATFTQRYFGAK